MYTPDQLKHVANKTNQIGAYLKNRGFDKEYYKKLVFEFIEKHKKGVIKGYIKELLLKKLPDFLTDSQKETKISNILRDLRAENKIYNSGSDARPNWQIKK